MSGIYIPGMKMPKGGECVVVSSDGTAYKYEPGDVVMYSDAYNEMADVIELPPHGRLADIDGLLKVIEELKWCLFRTDEEYNSMFDLINESETIIEAEEVE